MSKELEITAALRDKVHQEGAPPQSVLALTLVEELINKLLAGAPFACHRIADEICKDRALVGSVLAIAIGALAQAEAALQRAAETMDRLEVEDPAAVEAITSQVAKTRHG